MRYYAGIGSRQTPETILSIMTVVARKLSGLGYTLRSGGAAGADAAFALGASLREIYRPEQATVEALAMAATIHPAWGKCSGYAQRLHARNCFQVLGGDLSSSSEFVLCWTLDGCLGEASRSGKTGGTATAIVLAERHGIPVYNLQRPEHLAICTGWIEKGKNNSLQKDKSVI